MARKPTALDRFLPIDFEVLQYVADNKRINIEFETDNQANNSKQRLYRLTQSLMAYAKGDPLEVACRVFVFKVRGNIVTIEDRRYSSEAASQRAALEGKFKGLSADPQEIIFDTSIFDGADNGNEASEG